MFDYRWPIFLLIAVCLGTSGCTPHNDPLSNWHGIGTFDTASVPEVIKQDAMAYFQSLGPVERGAASLNSALYYLDDQHGSHAVDLSAPKDGERWHYVLYYDPNNRRVGVAKYSVGSYSS